MQTLNKGNSLYSEVQRTCLNKSPVMSTVGEGGRCSHVPCLGVWDIDLPELNGYVQGAGVG